MVNEAIKETNYHFKGQTDFYRGKVISLKIPLP